MPKIGVGPPKCIVCDRLIARTTPHIVDRRGWAAHLQCVWDLLLLAPKYRRDVVARMNPPGANSQADPHPPLRHAAC